MLSVRSRLLVGGWCGLIAAPFGLIGQNFAFSGWWVAALCAAVSGAAAGKSLLKAQRASHAAGRGLVITFGAYWLYMLALSCLHTGRGNWDPGSWLAFCLMELIYVGWMIFPVGALCAALLWTLNLRITSRIRSRRLEAAATEMDLTDR